MASNSNYYEAPQRRHYGSEPQQRQQQQHHAGQEQYAAQGYGNFNPYAQDAGNPYTDDAYENHSAQGYSQDSQSYQQARSQSRANGHYVNSSQDQQYQQQLRPQKSMPSSSFRQEQSGYQAQQQAGYRSEPSRSQGQQAGYTQDHVRSQGRQGNYGQEQIAYREPLDSYSRDQASYQQMNGYTRPSQQQQPPSNGYGTRGGQRTEYDQARSAQNSSGRPAPSRQDSRSNASYPPGSSGGSYQQNNGSAYEGQQGYAQAAQYNGQPHRQRYDQVDNAYSQSNGYHQDTQQGYVQDTERRYDPRYQQRRDPTGIQQPTQSVSSTTSNAMNGQYRGQPSTGNAGREAMDARTAQRSTQSSQTSVQSGPKKLSMEEWKAQEKARMHNDAKKPETIAQDNAFPTFPTKKAESVRGQSAMSMRSEDRPSTATSLRPPDTRPGLVRNHSSQQDLTESARPSMDSQPRIGSPLQRTHTPPQTTGVISPPRKSSFNSASPVRTHGYSAPAPDDQRTSSAEVRSDSASQTRPATSDSRYARKQSEQPLSPLGKFAQSAQDDAAPRPRNTQPTGHDNNYAAYHQPQRSVTASREEEIEAEAAMFDAAAPSQSELKKRRQTIDQHLGPNHDNNSTPTGVPSMPNFDFGFGQQNPYSQQPLDRPVQPYADETQGRRSMDNNRQPMPSSGRPVQPFANDTQERHSLDYVRQPAHMNGRPFAQETQERHSLDQVRQPALVNGRPAPQRFYGGVPRPDYDRQNTALSDPGVRRVGSAPPINNPDALPAHPTPVRPGLSAGAGTAGEDRPAPVRTYGMAAATPAPTARVALAEVPSREAAPVTASELSRLRAQVDANPSSMSMSLDFAKKLVEASKILATEGGRADPKTAAKNRERYLMEAYKRVKKLSSGGYPPAQFYLADCYGQGTLGLEVDPKEAFKLYQAAAKAGHATAAYRTAVCCEIGAEDGGGTSKDLPRAVQWYRRAAALGETGAMFKVGMIALKGLLGQPKNLGEATIWLKRAAERADRENPHALHELAQLYETANSTPELRQKIIPDDAYSLSMYKQAADLGSKYAQFRLGQCYEYGQLGLPIDHRSSIAWYSKAAAQGEHQAELALSGWYLTGAPGILQQSDVEAYLWARKAAQAEPVLAKALFAMAYFLETGIGCPVNLDEAKRWYSRAASYKHPRALERLEAIKRGAKGGYKAMPVNARSKLNRKDQKQDEQECVLM